MSALQEQFVTEARELIRQATDDLIALERDGASPERIDRVFRAFHTLKGSAGVVELPAMSIMLHAAEDLLASVRQGALDSGPDIIDAALACLDQVSRWVDDFEADRRAARAGGRGWPRDGGTAAIVSAGRGGPAAAGSAARKSTAGVEAGLPEWAARLIAAERDAMASRMPKRASAVLAISYQPIAGCFYNGDDPLQLMRQVPDLLAFHIEPREAFAPLADIDPYACNLRLQAISAGDRDEIARIFRLVPDQVRIVEHSAGCACRDSVGCERRRPNLDPGGHRGTVRTAAGFRQDGRFCRLHRRRGTCRNQCSASRRSSAIGGYGRSAPAPWPWRSATRAVADGARTGARCAR